VTLGTQFGLLAALELDVTRSAFLLDVGVTVDDFARHDQRLKLGVCVLESQQADNDRKSEK
jgi:hypothetical protein